MSRPDSYGLAGLAIAQSIVAAVEVAILSVIMLLRDRKLVDRSFWSGIWRIISVTGFSIFAGSTMVALFPLEADDTGLAAMMKLSLITLVTFTVHIGLSALFSLDEVRPVFSKARQLAKLAFRPIRT